MAQKAKKEGEGDLENKENDVIKTDPSMFYTLKK